MSNDFDDIDFAEKFDNDFEFFVNFIHKRLEGEEFEWNGYNKKIKTELMNTYKLMYLLLVINIPPRLGKTTLVTYFLAWTMYKSRATYNNYYTYSDLLVGRAYSTISKIFKITEVSESMEYSFKREKEDFSNGGGGGLYAQTTFGQVTGFGAGRKDDEEFGGCIVIDDPHKSSDSVIKMMSANSAIKKNVLTRKNNHKVPIILIMQRLGKFDFTAFLKEHFSEWFEDGRARLLKIPAEINGKSISSKEYPIASLKLEKEKDSEFYWTQLMQEPLSADGKYFKDKHFELYSEKKTNRALTTISFNPENVGEPIVFIAFEKGQKDAYILDYKEESVEADSFFTSLKDFCELNDSKKVYIPKNLITKTVKQELKPLRVEEVEEIANIGLSAFYAIGLLKGGKIKLKEDEINSALKEELKLYPNSKRDFATKAMINVLETLFIKSGSRISSSI